MAEKDDDGTEPAGLTSGKGPQGDGGSDRGGAPEAEIGKPEPAKAESETTEPEMARPEQNEPEMPGHEQNEPEKTGPEKPESEEPQPGKPEQPPAGLPQAPAITGFPKPGVDPIVADEGAGRAQAPAPVRIAFVLTIVAAVVLVVGQVVTILLKQQLVDQAVKSVPRGQKVDVAAIESNANVLVWAFFVGAVCFGAILVLFAYKAREGTRSARTVVTLLGVLGVVFELRIVPSLLVFSVVASLVLVVMVILLYVPGTRDFFPKIPKKLPKKL